MFTSVAKDASDVIMEISKLLHKITWKTGLVSNKKLPRLERKAISGNHDGKVDCFTLSILIFGWPLRSKSLV